MLPILGPSRLCFGQVYAIVCRTRSHFGQLGQTWPTLFKNSLTSGESRLAGRLFGKLLTIVWQLRANNGQQMTNIDQHLSTCPNLSQIWPTIAHMCQVWANIAKSGAIVRQLFGDCVRERERERKSSAHHAVGAQLGNSLFTAAQADRFAGAGTHRLPHRLAHVRSPHCVGSPVDHPTRSPQKGGSRMHPPDLGEDGGGGEGRRRGPSRSPTVRLTSALPCGSFRHASRSLSCGGCSGRPRAIQAPLRRRPLGFWQPEFSGPSNIGVRENSEEVQRGTELHDCVLAFCTCSAPGLVADGPG